MKIRRIVKRLAAVGTGAAMLGATAMGALAADLSSYPTLFVENGAFNGFLVVGKKAQSVDNLALTDIAANMFVAGSTGTTMTVEGDAWKVESGSDVLEFGENIGPSTGGVVDFLDDTDLAALADGELVSSQGSFKYEQFLHFDKTVVNTTYAEDDDDVTALFLRIVDNNQFARYELNFLEAAETDIDASESFKLDDYEDKKLHMLGKTYDVVKAVTGGANSNKVTLTLMSGAVTDSLMEGESQTYTIGGKTYDIELTFTDENSRAKFVVNGEATPLMDEGNTETLSDGTVLGLSQVLYQNYAGGVHRADFFLGADKILLEDDDITVGSSTDELQVNDETIDGAKVIMTGSMLDNATSTTEDGELELDTIQINMTAQEDYFIAVGEALSAQAEFEEKDLLFTQNWDIQFKGLDSAVVVDEISVKDKSGEKEYELTFTNVNGDVIKVPIAYATAASTVRPGDQSDRLFLNHSQIGDEGYFILNDDTDEDSITEVVQYKGSDDNSTSNPKIKFKILSSGETVERPLSAGTSGNAFTATLKLSGTTYSITSSGAANLGNDDWNVSITGGDVGEQSIVNESGQHSLGGYFITRGGAKIWLEDKAIEYGDAAGVSLGSQGNNEVRFNVSLIDGDRHDDVRGTDPTVASPYFVFVANISAASSELDFSSTAGSITLTSPDADTDHSFGYSSNGAFVGLTTPSGGGTSADSVVVDWPQVERTATVYVTSSATTTATKAAATADLKRVSVVDATKLDDEVTDADAQNLIVVGGPCVNTVAADLLGNPAVCTEGFRPGVARVKLFEHANGNMAMLVAGYSGADTRLAGSVIAHRWTELFGSEVEVEGTTSSDATISAPTVVVAAEEPAVEETAGTTE